MIKKKKFTGQLKSCDTSNGLNFTLVILKSSLIKVFDNK